jgi:hypothetical protein
MTSPRPHPTNPDAEIHDLVDEDGAWEATHHLGIGDGDSSPVDFRHLATGRLLRGKAWGLASVDDDEMLAALREAKRTATPSEEI